MSQTFDTYSKHSHLYKLIEIFLGALGINFLGLIIFQWVSIKTTPTIDKFFIITFSLSLAGAIIGMFIRIIPSHRLIMYEKDGNLEITENTVSVDSNIYNLTSLNKIEMKIDGFRGHGGKKGGIDGTLNKIKVYKNSNDFIIKSFVLNSRDELNSLKKILMQWKQNGFKIKVDGFDLR